MHEAMRTLTLTRASFTHTEHRREVIEKQIDQLIDRDIWRLPN